MQQKQKWKKKQIREQRRLGMVKIHSMAFSAREVKIERETVSEREVNKYLYLPKGWVKMLHFEKCKKKKEWKKRKDWVKFHIRYSQLMDSFIIDLTMRFDVHYKTKRRMKKPKNRLFYNFEVNRLLHGSYVLVNSIRCCATEKKEFLSSKTVIEIRERSSWKTQDFKSKMVSDWGPCLQWVEFRASKQFAQTIRRTRSE